ncbi:MAG: DUF1826 domain-containing protein [Polyangiales bacterium]
MAALQSLQASGSRTLWTSRKENLPGVRSSSYERGVWTRTLSPALRWRFTLRAAKPLAIDTTVERNDFVSIREALRPVEDAELEAFIAADLSGLLPLYDATLPVSRVRIRLDRVADNMCEKFHTDCLKLRLACTYAGVGTEWVDDVDANRDVLGSTELSVAETNAAVLRHADALRRCSVGDVLLLKGSEWSEAELGAIHRSPNFVGRGRILLRVDEPEPRL